MSRAKSPAKNLGNSIPEAMLNLLAEHVEKNPEGSGQDGRYAQYHAAEVDAWGAAYHYGLDTDHGRAFATVAGNIANEYHKRQERQAA
jgi:hypothetical protein